MRLPIDDVRAAFAADAEFALAARFWTARIAFRMGDERYLLDVVDGVSTGFAAGEDAADVTLAGPDADWAELLEPEPVAYYHDVLSGPRFGFHAVDVTGDRLTDVFPYYQAIRRAVELIGGALHPTAERPPTIEDTARRFDDTVGRYVHLIVAGVQYRVYFEESGSGIPLLLQHTAGSDGRQFRHLLEDRELQSRFRMIAFDLPYHGRSNPPVGVEWWAQEYLLTHDFLVEFVGALADALGVERAVFCGCSIGGLLAPDLALARPDLFRAVVALNGVIKLGSKAPDPVMNRSWADPRIGSGWHAAWMMGRTSPHSPEAFRRETAWYYAQAGPGVLRGDLHYYQAEHDLDGKLEQIDTSRCAVYVVAGEYDPSRVAAFGAEALAVGIPGAHYRIADGAGHFMMSEDPQRFRSTILPILDEIESTAPR